MSISKVNKTDLDNYMTITLSLNYGQGLVLPYKDGMTLLSALNNCKLYSKSYSEESKIQDLKQDSITAQIIGGQEYGEAILRNTLSEAGAS